MVRHRAVLGGLVGIIAAVFLAESQALASLTMADLLVPGASITVGDKQFFNFHDYNSVGFNGALAVSASDIAVLPYTNGGEIGLDFQSAKFHASVGQSQDTQFEFWVQVMDPGMYLSDATMTMTAAASGDASGHIAEVIRTNEEQLGGIQMGSLLVTTANGYAHTDLIPQATLAHVSKDVAVDGGTIEGSDVLISDFTQSFSQVPEPGIGLLVLTLAGLASRRPRKV